MTHPHSSSHLPDGAKREFDTVAALDWEDGIPLTELLERVNRVAAKFLPKKDGGDSRVKRTFSARSFRHYATHGCIDPAEKDGRRSVYRYRHFVQALLVRKLLWQRVPSEQIAAVMSGRGTQEVERMFLGGIVMVAKADGGESGSATEVACPGAVEAWRRVEVMPGVELHLRDDLPRLRAAELKELLARLESVLRD